MMKTRNCYQYVVLELLVVRICGVVLVRHDPLVDGEQSAGLQDPKRFRVNFGYIWGVTRGFDGVRLVEPVVFVGNVVKVTLH